MPCTVHQCLIFICNWLSFIILNQHGHLSPQVLLFLHKDTMCTKLCQFWRLIQIEWVFGLCSVTVTQTILGKMIWSVAHLWVCFLFRLKRSTGTLTPWSVWPLASSHTCGASLYILGCLLAEVLKPGSTSIFNILYIILYIIRYDVRCRSTTFGIFVD